MKAVIKFKPEILIENLYVQTKLKERKIYLNQA